MTSSDSTRKPQSTFRGATIAAALAVTTLLAASLLLPVVLKGLELPADDSQRHEEDLARRMSSRAALAAVERRRQEMVQGQATGPVQLVNDAAAQVSLLYQRNLSRAQDVDADPEQVARIERAYRQLRNAGLNAEREELFRLARRGRISDELSRKLIRNLDLLESRQRD